MQSRDQENLANFDKGKQFFKKGHYKQAAGMFYGLIKDSENPEYLYWYALTQGVLKNYRNAINYYQLAIDYISDSKSLDALDYKSKACIGAASACKEIHDYDQGLKYLNQARESYYGQLPLHEIQELDVLEGDLLQASQPLEALKKYNTVLEFGHKPLITSKKINLCITIGDSFLKEQNYAEAVKYFHEAVINTTDKNKTEFINLRLATCFLEQVKKDPKNNIFKSQAMNIFTTLKDNLTENNDFPSRVKSAYYSYMHDYSFTLDDTSFKKFGPLFNSLIQEAPYKYRAMVDYYLAEIYATTEFYEQTIRIYCHLIDNDSGYLAAYEGLYNCLIHVKKLERDKFHGDNLPLVASILTFPNQEKKIQLLKLLLDDKHPVGQFVLDKNNFDKDTIYSIIQAIPFEQGRMDYLIRACKKPDDPLYDKIHQERNKPGFLGGVAQKLTEELQNYQKYDLFFAPVTGSQTVQAQLEKMISMVPLTWMSKSYAFEPVMMSHIIRKFNEFVKSDNALHKLYGAFISQCSADDLFNAILSVKRPEDKVSPDISKILLDCLNKDTVLGKKFLVIKPDKDRVRALILALPENNPEELQAKKDILEKVLTKDEAFKSIFWAPRHIGATVSVEEGTLKQLNLALQDINAKLSSVLPAKQASHGDRDEYFKGFEIMKTSDDDSDPDLDDFHRMPGKK